MRSILISAMFLCAATSACNSDNDADALGIGAECVATEECEETTEQECLTDFKGGYCGIKDCVDNADCPDSSACVTHDDGLNYCFRTCLDKAECNANRSADQESNCSASIVFVEERDDNLKACVPPSG